MKEKKQIDMLSKITKVGTSVGVIIPKYIALEGGFSKGAPINIEYDDERIVITRHQSSRQGWEEAFQAYAKDSEEEQLLPDFLDSEAIELL